MSENRQERSDEAQHDRLAGAVRGVVSAAETPPTTATVADTLSLSRETAAGLLADLTEDGVVRRRERDDTVRWEPAAVPVRMHERANSYTVTDPETGIVSREASRPAALRRLADRLEQYAEGETIGAQVRGISEAVLSPAYAQGIGTVIREYVEPDRKHLYVYVVGEGPREITSQEQLHRDHTIAGFAVTGRFTRAEFDEAIQVPVERLLETTRIDDDNFPLSVFKLVAVHPDYQGQGVATALMAESQAYLAKHPPVVAMLWERETDDTNVSIAESHGAERLAEFEDTSPSKWKCPECGFGNRCTCKSAFYAWGLE